MIWASFLELFHYTEQLFSSHNIHEANCINGQQSSSIANPIKRVTKNVRTNGAN